MGVWSIFKQQAEVVVVDFLLCVGQVLDGRKHSFERFFTDLIPELFESLSQRVPPAGACRAPGASLPSQHPRVA